MGVTMQSVALNTVSVSTGGLFIVIAGLMNASFTLPMKRMRQWPWENAWLVWSATALLVLPIIAAFLTIPNLALLYMQVDRGSLLQVCTYGAGWGMAQVLFGLAVDQIGVALGFSVVLGVSAAVGTLIPFIRLHSTMLFSRTGLMLLSGLALVVLGVSFCAIAGQTRERELANSLHPNIRSFKIGLAYALLSGFLASLMNLGISFAGPLLAMAAQNGASPLWRANAIWPPLLAAGAIPNIIYCLYLIRKNRGARHFYAARAGLCWMLSVFMGVLWFGGHIFFGAGSLMLGSLGPVLGWPAYMSLIVISASVYGFLTGEWRHVSARPFRIQLVGIGVLCAAVFLFSRIQS